MNFGNIQQEDTILQEIVLGLQCKGRWSFLGNTLSNIFSIVHLSFSIFFKWSIFKWIINGRWKIANGKFVLYMYEYDFHTYSVRRKRSKRKIFFSFFGVLLVCIFSFCSSVISKSKIFIIISSVIVLMWCYYAIAVTQSQQFILDKKKAPTEEKGPESQKDI